MEEKVGSAVLNETPKEFRFKGNPWARRTHYTRARSAKVRQLFYGLIA